MLRAAIDEIISMARKSRHTTEHTAGEVEGKFEDVVTLIGGGYDSTRAQRLLRLPIDGIELRDRKHDLRKPNSIFYSQEFFEALAVAGMLVDLDIDGDVTNIVRRDRPDVSVEFYARANLYVEHTNVAEYEGMVFGRHLEEINNSLNDLASHNQHFDAMCDAGTLTIRLTDPGLDQRLDPDSLAREVVDFSSVMLRESGLQKPSAKVFPSLERYAARVFYHPGRTRNPRIVQQEGAGFFDPRPGWIPRQLRVALEKKRVRARLFDPALRPLWLLMTLDVEGGFYPPAGAELVKDALQTVDIEPYDTVVVTCPGMAPVVRTN